MNVSFFVPSDVDALVASQLIGNRTQSGTDGVGSVYSYFETQAVLTESKQTFSVFQSGTPAESVLTRLGGIHPTIPVSAGSRLMVAFEDAMTAVLFFDVASV
jgi:hypothetical protein